MKSATRHAGFTMIELMIVMGVIAILVAIAYPMFTSQIQKARRADAQQELLDMALRQEKWRANNVSYGTMADIGAPCPGSDACNFYNFTVGNVTATTYTLTATPTGDQSSDKQGSTSCDPLTLDQSDDKTPAECW